MKRLCLLTLPLLAMSSCIAIETQEVDVNGRQEIVIDAQFADESVTKTVYNEEDGFVYWKPGDEINVFFGNDSGKFTSINDGDAKKASFSGTLTITSIVGLNEGENDDNCLWGLYPYNPLASFDGSSVTTVLEEHQIGCPGSFVDDTYITLARNNSFSLSFYNVLCGLRFSVAESGITSVEFSGNNNEKLAGTLSLTFGEDGKPLVTSVTDGSEVITLTPEGGEFEVGEKYYILFVPTNFANGFSVRLYKDNTVATFEYNSAIEFRRNVFKNKNNIDSGLVFEQFRPNQNQIWYTTSNGSTVTPTRSDTWGRTIVSNTYNDGKGVITFNGDLSAIGYNAFYTTTSSTLTSVTIPEGVTTIQSGAFEGCQRLAEVVMPKSLTEIGARAFYHCYDLSNLTIPLNVNSIGVNVFNGCNSIGILTLESTSLDFGDERGPAYVLNTRGVNRIISPFATEDGKYLIKDGQIVLVAKAALQNSETIPPQVTGIAGYTFDNNTRLERVLIGSNIASIGAQAFYNSSLTSIEFEALTPPSIGYSAFPSGLVSIYVPAFSINDYRCNASWSTYCRLIWYKNGSGPANNQIWYKTSDNNAIAAGGVLGLLIDDGDGGYYMSNSFVSNVYENGYGILTYSDDIGGLSLSYQNRTTLTSVVFPPTLTDIIGYSFSGCTSLVDVILPEASIEMLAFNGCTSLQRMYIPSDFSILDSFSNCRNLSSLYGPKATADHKCIINNNTLILFARGGTTSYTLPSSVKTIGRTAFYGVRDLTSVTFPASVTSIGSRIAENSSLSEIHILSTTPPSLSYGDEYPDSFEDFSGSIFVPLSVLNTYKNNTHWSYYSSQLVGE